MAAWSVIRVSSSSEFRGEKSRMSPARPSQNAAGSTPVTGSASPSMKSASSVPICKPALSTYAAVVTEFSSCNRFERRLDVAAEDVHRALRFLERHVADRQLQHEIVGQPRFEDRRETVLDLLSGAGTEPDRVFHVSDYAAERVQRRVALLLGQHKV